MADTFIIDYERIQRGLGGNDRLWSHWLKTLIEFGVLVKTNVDVETGPLPAHHSAPETSHQTAADTKVIRRANADRLEILLILKDSAPNGLTADEVQIKMLAGGRRISPNQVATRMLELRAERRVRYNMIEHDGEGEPIWETRPTSRGRTGRVQYLADMPQLREET